MITITGGETNSVGCRWEHRFPSVNLFTDDHEAAGHEIYIWICACLTVWRSAVITPEESVLDLSVAQARLAV